MLTKRNAPVHLIALGALCLGFVLCRYVLFDLHGMKQWPEVLFMAGLLALLLSFCAKGRRFPIFVSCGYILGFAAGLLFRTDGTDAGGAKTNSLWIIWSAVFVCFMVIGLTVDRFTGKKKSGHEPSV